MKIWQFAIIFILGLLAAACSSENIVMPDEPSTPDGTPIEIVAGAEFPGMYFGAATRAMNDQHTVDQLQNELHVNLFVFDPSGVMLQFIGPEDISIVSIDPDSKLVHFKVSNIYSSSMPRRLHFVVTSADDLHALSGGEYISAMASETTTMPALTVAGKTDAYWGARDVDAIEENMTVEMKLIRNFVKLTVEDTSTGGDFRLLGYTVVNRPGRGTIAPYIYRDHLFATFLNPDNSLVDYDQIIAQGYYGVNPAGGDEEMACTTEAEVSAALAESERRIAAGEADTPCYIYERSQSSILSAGSDVRVTYILLSGEYKGKKCYYKIDIGRDKEGKFGYYDLLRNFQYTVAISEVGGEGAPTVADAMKGAAHNNLSTSVVTRDLFSIGYEGEMIEVGSTRVIFTEKATEYALRFRYTTPTGMTFDPSKLKIYDLNDESAEYDMSGVTTYGTKAIGLQGDVIESAKLTRGADGWYELLIDSKEIPADSRRLEQNIRIYYNGGTAGLGRTVTLMLRRPWQFTPITANSPATTLFSDLNLQLELPSGFAKSQFPLILTFESDKQNIYSLNGTDLTVATGRSGFSGATTDRIILYEWRLEWADYEKMTQSGNYRLTASFRMNTTGNDDRAYSTAGIDVKGIAGRSANNGSQSFCIRVANKGMKYIEPYYVNITRR